MVCFLPPSLQNHLTRTQLESGSQYYYRLCFSLSRLHSQFRSFFANSSGFSTKKGAG
ncbi:hypothetical protein CLOSTASPAR_06420 [[Clostridium] asparagiforme DSM 15981]|uniref:Uncharacterized protein n=1 Tax=[Clostridium] asparagiforme DSM 15981 TaxID=518636 RepID=C0DAW6_9FIRM|nr:hypothetical protein CLOSTASPAR_06420 [[Clostridium] asparagiforme DSM 15981]